VKRFFCSEQRGPLNQSFAKPLPEISRENGGPATGTFGTEIKGRPKCTRTRHREHWKFIYFINKLYVFARGPWSFDAWARNLTNARCLRICLVYRPNDFDVYQKTTDRLPAAT
jgi:hypothetical protein